MKKTIVMGGLILLLIAGAAFAVENGVGSNISGIVCGATMGQATDHMMMYKDSSGNVRMGNMSMQSSHMNMQNNMMVCNGQLESGKNGVQ